MAARALTLAALLCASPLFASEADALAISANIRAKHMPFGTILDPMYAASTSDQIIGYTRCGDSALWTGAYLAAESFRYKVQPSADALANVQAALAGLKSLADVTGDNRLARCIVPADSPFAAGIESEEAHNTVHQSPPFVWLDNTSRDEVVGAFFGLSIAYDFVDDPSVKGAAAALIGRLIGFVQKHQWSPNDDVANTFLLRPEELRMLIQVANHVNPANPISVPFSFLGVSDAVAFDITSLNSYFKFNLDYMSLYNLIRLQNSSENQNAYKLLRAFTAIHQNAFFDIIDSSISGADAARDAEMRSLLDQWLQRPKRDVALIPASKDLPIPGTGSVPSPYRLPLAARSVSNLRRRRRHHRVARYRLHPALLDGPLLRRDCRLYSAVRGSRPPRARSRFTGFGLRHEPRIFSNPHRRRRLFAKRFTALRFSATDQLRCAPGHAPRRGPNSDRRPDCRREYTECRAHSVQHGRLPRLCQRRARLFELLRNRHPASRGVIGRQRTCKWSPCAGPLRRSRSRLPGSRSDQYPIAPESATLWHCDRNGCRWDHVECEHNIHPIIRMPDDLLRWRAEFPILADTTYMISHSLGAMPLRTRDRLNEFADTWATRGIRAWEEGWWDLPVTVGNLIASLIGAGPGEVVMHQNVSVCQSVILSCFDWSQPRNKIVTESLNFPSNLYLFQGVERQGARVVTVASEDGITVPLERLLAAIDEETKLVSVSHVIFKSSFVQDLRAITERAHAMGAMVVADLYQSTGTVPVDIRALNVDFATGGSVKWLCGGPGAAYLYVRPDLWPNLKPAMTGWQAHREPFAFDSGEMDYAPDAFRFLSGTPNVPALYSARSGYEIVNEIGVQAIRAKSQRQTERMIALADELDLPLNCPRDPAQRGGTVTLAIPNGKAVVQELARRNILVDYRPGAGIRIAPHFYTADDEVDFTIREISALTEAH